MKPEGKIEDVLVKVDKSLFIANFVILDYEADQKVPINFRQPFLPIGRTLIHVHQGELTMQFNNEEVKFNIVNAMKFPLDAEKCRSIKSLR